MTQLQSAKDEMSPNEDVGCEYIEQFADDGNGTDAQIWDCAGLITAHHSYYRDTKSYKLSELIRAYLDNVKMVINETRCV